MSDQDVCFVNSEHPPIETKHVCWFVRRSTSNPEELNLCEEGKISNVRDPKNVMVIYVG